MLRIILGVSVGYAIYRYFSPQTPYAGFVSSGWGSGNAGGNLPGVVPANAVLGTGLAGGIGSPPGVGFMPSTTSGGSR